MRILAISFSLFIASCASLIKSENELLETGGKSKKYCSELNASDLKTNLEKYFHKCFLDKPTVFMNGSKISGDYYLSKRELADATQYVFIIGPYYNAAITIFNTSGEHCKSELQIISSNKNANDNSAVFKPYIEIVEGKIPSCF